MPEDEEQRYRDAYEQLFQGNVDPIRAICAEDYVLHMPVFDMTVNGRDQALETLSKLIQQANIRGQIDKFEKYGDFVVMCVSGSSDIRGDWQGVDVARLDSEGRAVESYLLRRPLPPGTDVPGR